ncbi:MAG: hypothetical protein IJH41_03890 [Eubacterium sp.]|nr:hypothetical protein [Eubacterium sp.]MBQ4457998.1 hypothetical protein [Clostridia bacterium]
MSDEQIREILRERKREQRELEKAMRREEIKEGVEGFLGWTCLFGLGYMMFVFGQVFV